MPGPQGPTTNAGRWFLDLLYIQARHVSLAPELTQDFPQRILAIEAEARAAAPPDGPHYRHALDDDDEPILLEYAAGQTVGPKVWFPAAPPDIDVELHEAWLEARDFMTALIDSLRLHTNFGGNDYDDSLIERASGFLAARRHLASPDATEKKPFEYQNLGYAKGPGR